MAARHTHTLTDPETGLTLKLVRYRATVHVRTAGEEQAYVGFLDCRLSPQTRAPEYRAAGGSEWRPTAERAVADLLRLGAAGYPHEQEIER